MSVEENKAIAHRIVDEFLDTGDFDSVDEFFATDFINHNPDRGITNDREGIEHYIAALYPTFPDLNTTIVGLSPKNKGAVMLAHSDPFSPILRLPKNEPFFVCK